MKPVVIDLFCGLGGWTRGFLAEGYDAIGFDIERHRYPTLLPAEWSDDPAVKCSGQKHNGSGACPTDRP